MNSCLFRGSLMHRRTRPRPHEFRYAMVAYYLDLDELAELGRRLRLFGWNRRAPIAFYDRDHVEGGPGTTAEKIRAFLAARGLELDGGKVFLLTQCRMFGYVFNPVSFFYCHRASGELAAIVAEVNNTFGERHLYCLDEANRIAGEERRHRARKEMHVSPFVSMDAVYDFTFAPIGERLAVSISETEAGAHFFDAHWTGLRHELSDANLLRVLVAYPFLTLRITAAIHWQAFHLWRKRVPVHRQPAPSPEQQTQLEALRAAVGGKS